MHARRHGDKRGRAGPGGLFASGATPRKPRDARLPLPMARAQAASEMRSNRQDKPAEVIGVIMVATVRGDASLPGPLHTREPETHEGSSVHGIRSTGRARDPGRAEAGSEGRRGARPDPSHDGEHGRLRAAAVRFRPWIWLPMRLGFGIRKPRRRVLGQELAGDVERNRHGGQVAQEGRPRLLGSGSGSSPGSARATCRLSNANGRRTTPWQDRGCRRDVGCAS